MTTVPLPADVAASLPSWLAQERIGAYVRLHGALDSPLGESHLVAGDDGRLAAITRRSPFDPFQVVEIAAGGVRYERATFARKLTLTTTAGGKHEIDVSVLDLEGVEAFTRAIGGEPRKVVDDSPARTDAPTQPIGDPRTPVRSELLGLLAERTRKPRPATTAPKQAPRARPVPSQPSAPLESQQSSTRKKKAKNKRPEAPNVVADWPRNAPMTAPMNATKNAPIEPLFRTGHYIALLVVAPLIFLAFVLISRAMK